MSIPKIIHYCWFGKGKMNEQAEKYLDSWRKICPDYVIKEWNEDNFDINSNQYVKEAYENRKYAFVTDYVRLYALYNEGGIYMDTDVELIKPLDGFLTHKAFTSFENNDMIPTGLMAAEKGNLWIKALLDEYTDLRFVKPDGTLDLTTNVVRITELTKEKYGLIPHSSYQDKGDVTLYPFDYFCPKDWETGKINLTPNTHAIHHFAGSWHSEEDIRRAEEYRKRLNKYNSVFGEKNGKTMLLRVDSAKYYLHHPIKAVKRLIKGSAE